MYKKTEGVKNENSKRWREAGLQGSIGKIEEVKEAEGNEEGFMKWKNKDVTLFQCSLTVKKGCYQKQIIKKGTIFPQCLTVGSVSVNQ